MGSVEEMVLPDNTPARTYPLLQPRVVSIAQELHANSRRRRSISLTLKTNAKQSSQSQSRSPKTLFTKLSPLPVKSVLLYDWWLVPVDTKGLAVAGFASRGSQGVRTLHSAAIVKRHDTTTLETADGIMVTISGLIDRSRTCLNGFPLEVCNHFLLGFPHYWEEYADQCCGQVSVGKGVPTRISSFFEDVMSSGSCSSTFPPFSLDEIPMTRVRDFIMSPQRDVENGCLAQKLFDDVVEKCGYSVVQDESACKRKKNGGQFKMDTKVFTPSSIVTRSMSRLKNLVMEHEESLSSKPSTGDEKTSKGRGKQSEGVGSESGSKECHETTVAQEDKQVMGNPDKSTLRRSSRHMNQKRETHPHL
ncbi:hypothetical protein LWI28_023527 [Acer negundo]|uniref:SANTA domain-containing protein n=1 Tax=Acer negundo TaxID=4023 RepID=A0AAD5P2X4_ACENE|nr:hypothetical protein LWI28_023527 [Acer negundo]KAK4857284.1 hypothetical protein QYF36_026495 [Acer negundo]